MKIAEELVRCRQWIENALDKGGNTHNFIDICEGVLSGTMQLWSNEKACAITEIVVYPNKKVFHVFLAGGKMEEVLSLHDNSLEWAKSQGCEGMTLSGRKGWTKALKDRGWNVHQTVLAKEF